MTQEPPKPADPFQSPFRVRPVGDVSPYRFAVALLTLYLVMRYVPEGYKIGLLVLLGAFLSTPAGVKLLTDFLKFLREGV